MGFVGIYPKVNKSGDSGMSKNYLILVGAPKCGTTTIASWLGGLPDVVLTGNKETLYFTDFADRDWGGPDPTFAHWAATGPKEFEAEFAADPDASLRIEASTDNMCCPAAAENIARFADRADVGTVWVLALLRDPVDRIVSEFEHTLRLGWQRGSLMTSLHAEADRIAKGWPPLFWHVTRSRYAAQLARYRDLFGARLRIVDFHRIGDQDERASLLRWIGRGDDATEAPLEHQNQRVVLARPGAVGLLRNARLASLGRALVPKTLRPAVRRLVTGPPVERYRPSPEEIDFIVRALKGDIDACIAAPDIPTQHWDTTMRARLARPGP